MKNLLTVIKISLCFSIFSAFASPVATVLSVKGNAFAVTDGKTIPLRPGFSIEEDSHLISEIGSKVTFVDYFDRSYDLAGGGHVRILQNQVQLNRGYLWVHSYQNKQSLQIKSANAKVNLSRGEVVFSFDSANGRSQLLCVEGAVTLSNKIDSDFYSTLGTGEFSFIDPQVNDGLPRGATKIGFKSFEKMAALFDKENELNNRKRRKRIIAKAPNSPSMEAMVPSRMPASVGNPNNEFTASVNYLKSEFKADLTEVTMNKPVLPSEGKPISPVISSSDHSRSSLIDLYKEKKTASKIKKPSKKKVIAVKKSNVKVRTFGSVNRSKVLRLKESKMRSPKSELPRTIGERLEIKKRTPASVPSYFEQSYNRKNGSGFTKSLEGHYKTQQKHPNEVNSLIRELRNYKEDYTPNY